MRRVVLCSVHVLVSSLSNQRVGMDNARARQEHMSNFNFPWRPFRLRNRNKSDWDSSVRIGNNLGTCIC